MNEPDPLRSTNAELFVQDATGAWVSLGKVESTRIDDPEDLLTIPIYEPATPAEIARRLREEFGV